MNDKILTDSQGRPYVPWDLITSFITDAFVAAGVPKEDAAICADVLAESDRRGIESHGCNRFKPIYIDRIQAGIQKPVTQYEVLKETPTTLVVDAHDGMGMVASHHMMVSLIEKASTYGLGDGLLVDEDVVGKQPRVHPEDSLQHAVGTRSGGLQVVELLFTGKNHHARL